MVACCISCISVVWCLLITWWVCWVLWLLACYGCLRCVLFVACLWLTMGLLVVGGFGLGGYLDLCWLWLYGVLGGLVVASLLFCLDALLYGCSVLQGLCFVGGLCFVVLRFLVGLGFDAWEFSGWLIWCCFNLFALVYCWWDCVCLGLLICLFVIRCWLPGWRWYAYSLWVVLCCDCVILDCVSYCCRICVCFVVC